MNRIEFGIFIKKTFTASWHIEVQEWRFRSGDRHYALDVEYEDNRSTYEPHLSSMRLSEWLIDNATDDTPRHRVKYAYINKIEKDRFTRDEAKAWIVKSIVTHEFT